MYEVDNWSVLVITLSICIVVNGGAVIDEEGDVIVEGLYSKPDNVVILTRNNFDGKIFGQGFAILVQFYNTYCGDCRNFRPRYKKLALTISHWNKILRLAALDCSVEENNYICRGNEVGYPTLRYFQENYPKDGSFGVLLPDEIHDQSVEEFRGSLARILQENQKEGYLSFAPDMQIYSYSSYKEAIRETPKTVLYTFLIFENENSSIGSELALDMNDYNRIKVKRVYEDSPLAKKARLSNFPAVVAVTPSCKSKVIKVRRNATQQSFLKCINNFLYTKNYRVPKREKVEDEIRPSNLSHLKPEYVDTVLYNDLEKTIRTNLHTEIVRRQFSDGERFQALLDFLDILITTYPFREVGNLKEYLTQLLSALRSRSGWTADDVYDMVVRFEESYAPVYISQRDFVACKGTNNTFRGHQCGLWVLFHTLTVNALNKPGKEGPKVLRAMHGYVKNFMMCGKCSRHFLKMSAERQLFDVKDNEDAMLWLWVSHNVVNLRLFGDITEDPVYPKIQFPSKSRCPDCRDSEGEWHLPVVSEYLKSMYSPQHIKEITRSSNYAVSNENTLEELDEMLDYLDSSPMEP